MIGDRSKVQSFAPDEVLIVEDERDTANLYQSYLRDRYSTELATNGEQALAKLDSSTDLILFDLDLPHGRQLLGKLIEEKIEHTDPPLILISTGKPTVNLLNNPIDKYEVKPIYQDELHSLIDDITMQNLFHHLATQLFRKRSKRRALSQYGKSDTEAYEELSTSIEETESKLSVLRKQIGSNS